MFLTQYPSVVGCLPWAHKPFFFSSKAQFCASDLVLPYYDVLFQWGNVRRFVERHKYKGKCKRTFLPMVILKDKSNIAELTITSWCKIGLYKEYKNELLSMKIKQKPISKVNCAGRELSNST